MILITLIIRMRKMGQIISSISNAEDKEIYYQILRSYIKIRRRPPNAAQRPNIPQKETTTLITYEREFNEISALEIFLNYISSAASGLRGGGQPDV